MYILKFLKKAEAILSGLNKKLSRKAYPQINNVEKWYADDPHSLKRSTFDFLNEKSIVFDLGGYEGQWTSDIYSRYKSQIYVFEPVKMYADLIKTRFEKNPDIHIFQLGLGASDSQLEISLNAFASSVISHTHNASKEIIHIKNFASFIAENNISHVDLVKINIEGSEYELLEFLYKEQLLSKIRGLLIQFHDFVPDAERRMQDIQQKLSDTHTAIFQYKYVWEYWLKK